MIRPFPAILALLAALLAGCVSDEPKHELKPQPVGVIPTRLGLWATFPEDTDANGYLDTVDVTVYVSSDAYAAPIAVPGAFQFKLLGKGGKELAKWDIPNEQAQKSARRMPAGPAYFFRLSILDVGTDKVEAQEVNLTAEFHPVSGGIVRAPMTSLRFGKVQS